MRLEGSDKEFEGFSNLILSLILSHFEPGHSDFSTLLITLTDAIMFNSEKIANPSLAARYTSVSTLFNSLPTPVSTPTSSLPSSSSSLRLTVLLKLISYASANDDFPVIRPALARFESWLIEWGFGLGTPGEEEGNRAVLLVSNHLSTRDQKPLARELLLAHLSAHSAVAGSSATPSSSAASLASQLIVLSLSLSDVFDFTTLTTLPSVSHPSIPSLAILLSIFQIGDVKAFEEFVKQNESMLKEEGLEVTLLTKKLKLLALAELCSKKVGEFVSYGEIAEALQLTIAKGDDGEEVETWVIDGKFCSLSRLPSLY